MEQIRKRSIELLQRAPLTLSQREIDSMELAGFGLEDAASEGAQIITLFSTAKIAGKVIVLLPGQTLPEHRHVDQGSHAAKEEILRVVLGRLFLYVDGPGNDTGRIPPGKEDVYTVRTEVELEENGQYVIRPGSAHWFSAGDEGCVLYSFSTAALDRSDVFTDPSIVR